MIVGEAGVDDRLEDLHALAGDLGAAQAANQLFALAAEHATDDDLDPALGWLSDDIHGGSTSAGAIQARDKYSPVSVLTRIMSPLLTNGGT